MIWKEVKTCANQSVRCGVITTQKSTFWKSFWTVRQYALPCIVHCDRVRRGVRVDEYWSIQLMSLAELLSLPAVHLFASCHMAEMHLWIVVMK